MSSANWSLPTVSSSYTNFISELNSRLDDLALGLDTTPTNLPSNAIRWSSSTNKWTKNGAALTGQYDINVISATVWTIGRNLTLSGDITATFSNVNGSASVNAVATLPNVNSNVGTFGSNIQIPIITANAKGLVTGISTVALGTGASMDTNAVVITGGSITGLTTLAIPTGEGTTNEGQVQWDNVNDLMFIGTGTVTKTFVDTNGVQTLTNKNYSNANLTGTTTLPIGTTLIAPMVWNTGSVLTTTAVANAFEYDGTNIFLTNSAVVRKALAFLDGTGATGTWDISITGNSATATTAGQLGGVAASSYALLASPAFTGTPTTNGIEIGYKNVPQNAQSDSYTLALTDSGKHIYSTNSGAQTISIPTNAAQISVQGSAFAIGTAVTIINNGTTAITFSTTGVTVYKAGTSAAWASGGTISVRGMASLLKVASDTWFISGVGLS